MYIGNEINRIDAPDKVLGRPVYAEDLSIKGALFGCVFRSTRPHAWIRKIDTSAALASPGIVKTLSCYDIPGENIFGIIKKDQPYLAKDRVRYIGEPVLVVLGETEEAARKASRLIRVEYDDIGVISDPFISGDSKTLIHEKGNLLSHRKVIKGDIEKAFREADVIVEHTYTTTWLDHAFMETESGVGYPDNKGSIVIISSTQNIHYKQKEISKLLAIPEEKIKVIQATTGGGFGGKLDVTVEGFIALSVYHTKRPVVMRFTREESFLSNTKRHPLYIEYKTGARKDGAITAVKVNITGDTGPFASYGETVCLRAAIHATGPYEIPNVRVDSRMFYTNNPVSGAMRGFGVPQLAFAHESQMDEIASMLRLDSFDVRIKNALRKGSSTATSQVLRNSVGIIETLKKVEPYWRRRTRKNDHTGFGLGCMYYGIGNTGVSNPANACLNITGDGKIALHTGACEIGQGSDTVLVQILQEALGLKIEDIVLIRGDTETSKDAGSSSASRQTYISGGAVFDAAKKMRQYLDEKGFYKGRTIREIYASEADKKLLEHNGFFDPPTTPVDPETSKGSPYATYAFATHMTEVEVERETGSCRVKKVYAAHDVGRAINLKNVRGQICGGIAMGVGFALMEEFVPGKSESFDNYYMPTSMDMPDVEVFIVEDCEPTGPFGAKGLGEPALIPQAASIVNAIKDATGVRAFDLPCHIERLKKLIEDKK